MSTITIDIYIGILKDENMSLEDAFSNSKNCMSIFNPELSIISN